jgi:protein-glutamine gamma-glutamyltransferase
MSRLLRVLFAGLLGGLAGLGFGPVFGGMPDQFLLAIAVVTAVSVAVAVVAALVTRLPVLVAVLAGFLSVAVVVFAVVRPEGDVRDGPWLLLTGALPVEPDGPALTAVTAFAGWVTVAACLLAVYSTNPLPPMVPPAVCLFVALGAGASGRPLPGWYAPAVVALLAALLATTRQVRLGRIVLSGVMLVGAAAVAGTLGYAAPGVGVRPPADARDLVDAPVQPRSGVSPLQQYSALREGLMPLRLTGTVTQSVDRLRMVALTRFDGTYWTVEADYRTAGTTLPAPPESTAAHGIVRQDVLVSVPGPLGWLPTAGRPTAVSVPGLGVDEGAGDVVIPHGQNVPAEYKAESVVYSSTPDQIMTTELARRITASDRPLPANVRVFADDAVAGQPYGPAQALALLNRFTRGGSGFSFDHSPNPPRGHGLYQIDQLLRTHRGTPEQYASAYAVMARYLGYDARVVMGFVPAYDRTGTSFTVTGRDVDVWVELRYEGLGWVFVNPTPKDNVTNPNAPNQREQERRDATGKAAEQQETPPDPTTPDAELNPAPPQTAENDNTLLIVSAIGGVVLVAILAIPLAKALRRSRRRRTTPRAAVLGAWRETVDRLREAGLPIPKAATTGDVVSITAAAAPAFAAPLRALAAMADRAGYAPDEPEPTLPVSAWTAATETNRRLRSTMPPLRRLAAVLDPRPLLHTTVKA